MGTFTIIYNGKSKVIKRIVEKINTLPGLGRTHDTAFYGDLGQEAYEHSQIQSGNPHNVTLEELGIQNIENQLAMILDTIGSYDYWICQETDEHFIDHDGDELILIAGSNLLMWH